MILTQQVRASTSRNTLFQKQMLETDTLTDSQLTLHFDMDIQNELACVIFDEIHYINDRDRGKVWEETIMMLPDHVLLVMLSATIDNVETFNGTTIVSPAVIFSEEALKKPPDEERLETTDPSCLIT